MPYRKSTWVRWFTRVPEPRSTRVFYLGMYVLWAIAGVSVLISPPTTLAGAIGETLAYIWGSFLAIGSAGAATVVLTKFWWVERVFIWLAGTGIFVYAMLVGSLHFMQDGNRVPQFSFILAGLLALAIRYLRIRGSAYQPGK